jgi:hypothetical protein
VSDSSESREATERILAQHVAQLLEHFDSVRIFVTRQVPGEGHANTAAANDGGGNWYASLGQVREWLIQQDHRARVYIEGADASESD